MLFMHHEQKVNFIIVSNELQKITAFTMPWPLINILSQLQMFKKRYVVFELIFWKIKFNNSFNNTVQHICFIEAHCTWRQTVCTFSKPCDVSQNKQCWNHCSKVQSSSCPPSPSEWTLILCIIYILLSFWLSFMQPVSSSSPPHPGHSELHPSLIFIFTTTVHTLLFYDGSLESVHQIA